MKGTSNIVEQRTKEESLVKRIMKHDTTGIILFLLLYAAVMASININFISLNNIRNIATQIAVPGILSLGLFILMLAGNTDLSIAWMATFLACSGAVLMVDYGFSVPVTILLIFVVSIVLEAFMGYIIAKTKVTAFIISIGFQAIYQSFTYLITDGSEKAISGRLSWLNQFPLGLSTLVYIFAVVAIILAIVLKYTKFGRRIYAVGANNDAAYLAGINVLSFKVKLFMLNGFLVALAAVLQMARLDSASPSMALGLEINAVAACVVGGTAMSGGKGNTLGVLVGIILLGLTKNSMTMIGVSPYIADFAKGFIIVVAVVMSKLSAGSGFKFYTKSEKKKTAKSN